MGPPNGHLPMIRSRNAPTPSLTKHTRARTHAPLSHTYTRTHVHTRTHTHTHARTHHAHTHVHTHTRRPPHPHIHKPTRTCAPTHAARPTHTPTNPLTRPHTPSIHTVTHTHPRWQSPTHQAHSHPCIRARNGLVMRACARTYDSPPRSLVFVFICSSVALQLPFVITDSAHRCCVNLVCTPNHGLSIQPPTQSSVRFLYAGKAQCRQ